MNAIIVSAVFGVLMMFASFLVNNKNVYRYFAIIGLSVLLLANILETYAIWSINFDSFLQLSFERFGLFFNSIAIAATLFYVLLSGRDIVRVGNYSAEYFVLIFFILCGVSLITSYNSLLMLFLGIEIISIPLYILTGSDKKNLKSNEAALKYFLMGAFSTGLMLMGIALSYGAVGNFGLEGRGVVAFGGSMRVSFLEVAGLLLLFISMSFKASAAPFHFWTPDVYEGAPSVFTSFMATIVKATVFIGMIKLLEARTGIFGPTWQIILPLMIVLTLAIGNITAVFQQSVKRMLAYSSIAQAGFMLFALWSANDMGREGILLYSVAYTLATVGIFAVLVKMKDYTFDGFNGLAAKQPLVAASVAVFVLSLAGIPLTAGFFAKYFMLASAIKSGAGVWLLVVAVVFAAVSVYYYFRLIQAMYFKEGEAEMFEQPTNSFKGMLAIFAVLLIVLGIAPSLLFNFLYF